jgi:hypothetical protein
VRVGSRSGGRPPRGPTCTPRSRRS